MAYFVALASAFLVLSAATALRPGRRGLFAAFAYPVGWAAGELAGQGIFIEAALLTVLWWWGWPRTNWLSLVVVVLASAVVLENLTLIVFLFRSRSVVRRSMGTAAERPLSIPTSSEDAFGSWWRTALQIPFHPRDMQLLRNVAYGPLERHRLDVWRLSTTPLDAPVIFYLHGGAWRFGDKREQGRPMLHEFVRRGWIVVASNYRLAPINPWPAQIEDATRALGWIKKNIATYGGDPDRVVVAGGSAGGHLASLLALSAEETVWRPRDSEVTEWGVRGALSFYGVLEMTGDETLWRGKGGGLRQLLERTVVQVPYVANEDIYRLLSPYDRIASNSPPFFVVQGVNDTLVDVNVARAFVEKFRAIAFAPIYYVELPFTQHSFDVTASPRTSATTRAAVAFAQAVAPPRPTISPRLIANYQAPPTRLHVEVSAGEWREARDVALNVGPFYVVTSDNPYSKELSTRENVERRVILRRFLERRGIEFMEARGRDVDGRWPEELGVALKGLSRDDVGALARSWDQFAYYEITVEGVAVRDAISDEVLI